MPRFAYRALEATGGEVAGELVAVDERDAAARLQATGAYPIQITISGARRRFDRLLRSGPQLATRELALLTRQLATLVGAGVALDRALEMLAATGSRARARLAAQLLGEVNRGEALSLACAKLPGLPSYYGMMVGAGEASGDLGLALECLAEMLERRQATARALADALVYPAAVFVVGLVSVSFLLSFVVPRFETLLAGMQREAPLGLRLLVGLSATFQTWALPTALALAGLFFVLLLRYRNPGFRLSLHQWVLRSPGLGPLIGRIAAQRLLFFLGTMLSAGVALPAALSAARAAAANEVFRADLALLQQRIERGDGIAASFAGSGIIPDVAAELVRVSEETGVLPTMLFKAAEILHRDFELATRRAIALVTPVSIVSLGLLIAAVAAALLGAVLEVYDVAL